MRLISVNLWRGEKSEEIKQFLQDNREETDIFCFQEAQGAEGLLKEALSGHGFFMKDGTKRAFEKYKLRIYVRKSIEIVSVNQIGLDLYESGAAMAMEILTDNGPLIITNVHGVSRPGDKLDTPGRIKLSEGITDYLKDKRDRPQIICGDFNLQPYTKSVEILEDNGYHNLIKEYRISTTRNELAWDRFPGNKQLFADYTFVSGEVEVRDFKVPNVPISDHLPMILDFVV